MIGLFPTVVAVIVFNVVLAMLVVALRLRSDRRERSFRQVEARWDPLLVRVIGGEDVSAPTIRPDEARHVLVVAGAYARCLRGSDLDRLQAFVEPYARTLLPELRSRSAEKRATAAELLGVLALHKCSRYIVETLDDPSPRVSLVAARALSRPEYPEHTAAVLDRVHRYSHWSPSLISSMLALVGSGAMEDLRSYLADPDRPSRGRAVVAGTLRLLRDARSAPIAAAALDSDNPDLVVSSLRLISAVGSSQQAESVRPMLEHDVFFVRAEAASVLSKIGDPWDVDAVANLLHGDSPWAALRSAKALMALGERQMLEDLSRGHGLASESAREALQVELV
ncbi:MAG: hypothetical protein ABFR95_01235 [Actinomycetota bacterium]